MIHYSSEVIEDFAEKMYSHAAVIVALYAVSGFAFGFVGGWMIKGAAGGLIAGLVGSGLGAMVGQAKTATLRLQAQIALCLVEIERNTRGSPDRTSANSAATQSKDDSKDGVTTCRQCDAENNSKDKYCQKCGEELSPRVDTAASSQKRAGWITCPNCGTEQELDRGLVHQCCDQCETLLKEL